MKIKPAVFLLLLSFACFSCDVLRDKPFEVIAWTPGAISIEDEGNITVSLTFSIAPEYSSIESSFSLTEDGYPLKGRFIWQDRNCVFQPAAPLKANKDYIITLGTEAQTERGLSLENKFEGRFSTRINNNRPIIKSIEPGNESIILDNWQEIKFEFNEVVLKSSCENDILFSPSMNGSWQLLNGGKTALFIPKEKWINNETYKITVLSTFKSSIENQIGKNFVSRFTVLDDKIPAEISAVYAFNDDNETLLLPYDSDTGDINSLIYENSLFDNLCRLKLLFTKEVDVSGIQNYITIEPSLKFHIDNLPGFSDTIEITLTDTPEWGSRFLIKIKQGIQDRAGNKSEKTAIYRILANAGNSKPPKLVGLRLPESFVDVNTDGIKKLVFTPDDLFEYIIIDSSNYPNWTVKSLNFELYFEMADDAGLNLFSLRDLFRIETTNNALYFSPKAVIDHNFTQTSPAVEFAEFYRVEVRGEIENTTNFGIIKFYIPPGLCDVKSNINNKAQSIQLSK